jgi:hypothetical protein
VGIFVIYIYIFFFLEWSAVRVFLSTNNTPCMPFIVWGGGGGGGGGQEQTSNCTICLSSECPRYSEACPWPESENILDC